jgi:hypothetical protein
MFGIFAGRRVGWRLLLVLPVAAAAVGLTGLSADAQTSSVTPPAVGVANGLIEAQWDHYCSCYNEYFAGPLHLTGYVPSLGGTAPGSATLGYWGANGSSASTTSFPPIQLSSDTTTDPQPVPFAGQSNDGFTFSGSCSVTATADMPVVEPPPTTVFTMSLSATCTVSESGVQLTWTFAVNGAGPLPNPTSNYAGVYQFG